MTLGFTWHGGYQILPDGIVVTLTLTGHHEAALELLKDAQQIVLEMQGSSFGGLVTLDNEWFTTADANPKLRKLTEWAIQQGLSREAIVTDSPIIAELVDSWILPTQTAVFE